MKSKLSQEAFDARCWHHIKDYFKALDKEHIINATEHSIAKTHGRPEES